MIGANVLVDFGTSKLEPAVLEKPKTDLESAKKFH
jgi:hypothetical protein